MVMFQNVRKRASRRGWPIMGYVGPNGGGKSASMVWDTLPSLAAGRPVLSTVRILDYVNPRECDGCDEPDHLRPIYGPVVLRRGHEPAPVDEDLIQADAVTGAPEMVLDDDGVPIRRIIGHEVHKQAHPLYVKFSRWEQLMEARGCDILMDEVTGVASSRESQSMPAPVANKLVQLRRADVVLRWSSPSWARSDKIIRECSQAVTYCRGHLPKTAPGTDRLWRQRRLFVWKTYDAMDFEDFTSGKREQLPALQSDLHWGPKSPVFKAYDTYDSVASIGTVTDSGRCYSCGGRREIPKCRCSDHGTESGHAEAESGGKAGGRPRRSSANPQRKSQTTEPLGARSTLPGERVPAPDLPGEVSRRLLLGHGD